MIITLLFTNIGVIAVLSDLGLCNTESIKVENDVNKRDLVYRLEWLWKKMKTYLNICLKITKNRYDIENYCTLTKSFQDYLLY